MRLLLSSGHVPCQLTADFPARKFRRVNVDVGDSCANRANQLKEFAGLDALILDSAADHVGRLQDSVDHAGLRTARSQTGWVRAGFGLTQEDTYRPVDRVLPDVNMCLLHIAVKSGV